MRINLWSGPRNVSTALMYSFAQRPDTTAVDEPHYGHYLRVTGALHPGDEAIMSAMDCDGERVTAEVLLGNYANHVFFKNMAHHLVDLDRSFINEAVNVLLIRDPQEMLPSYSIQIPDPQLWGIGFPAQIELMERLGDELIVLDAEFLLRDPTNILKQLCHRLGLTWNEAMLSWPAGPKDYDGVWAPHWYHRVHESSGFAPYEEKSDPFPERLRPLLNEAAPLYARLRKVALRS